MPAEPPTAEQVPSPCIGTCTLDARKVCVGCHRTLAEIAEWPDAQRRRRLEILRQVARRRIQQDQQQ